MKKLYIILIIGFVFSCNNKKDKNCTSKEVNAINLKKYLVLSDTCKAYRGYNYVEYYDNERLLMSGFSERSDKQGQWSFFDKENNEIVKGGFEDSQPKGEWLFESIKEVDWRIYKNLKKGYFFSYPLKWKIIESKENNSVVLFDDKTDSNFSNYNLKFVITSIKLQDLEGSIESLYESSIASLKQDKVKNLNYKEIIIEDSGANKFYEIQYDELNNKIEYFSSEFMFTYNDNLYLKSISIKKGSKYDYRVIKEIIDTSFKVFND